MAAAQPHVALVTSAGEYVPTADQRSFAPRFARAREPLTAATAGREARSQARAPGGPDPSKLRVPGKGKGRFRVKQGFDDPLPEDVLRLFED